MTESGTQNPWSVMKVRTCLSLSLLASCLGCAGGEESLKARETRRIGARLVEAIASWEDQSLMLPPAMSMWRENDINLGSESLYFVLHHLHRGSVPNVPLGDTDGDRGETPGGRTIGLEYHDGWGHPIIYIPFGEPYRDMPIEAVARYRNAWGADTTVTLGAGSVRRTTGYLLCSLGPDGQFGTPDDLVLETSP